MNRKDKIVSAVGATFAAGAIGGGVTVASAQPTPAPPPAPTVVAPELEGSAECAGGVDTDNIQEATRTARRSRTIARPLHRPDLENASVTPER